MTTGLDRLPRTQLKVARSHLLVSLDQKRHRKFEQRASGLTFIPQQKSFRYIVYEISFFTSLHNINILIILTILITHLINAYQDVCSCHMRMQRFILLER